MPITCWVGLVSLPSCNSDDLGILSPVLLPRILLNIHMILSSCSQKSILALGVTRLAEPPAGPSLRPAHPSLCCLRDQGWPPAYFLPSHIGKPHRFYLGLVCLSVLSSQVRPHTHITLASHLLKCRAKVCELFLSAWASPCPMQIA